MAPPLTQTKLQSSASVAEIDEYESTIKYVIPPAAYEQIRATHQVIRTDIIVHYVDQSRKVRGAFQRKQVISKTRLLHLNDEGHWFPLTRKRACERSAPIPTSCAAIDSIITRYVLREFNQGAVHFRIALEARGGVRGGALYLSAEVEYPSRCWRHHDELLALESRLVTILPKPWIPCEFQPLTFATMPRLPSRRFHPLSSHKVDRAAAYVYKMDGHKGRMVGLGPGQLLLYDDLHYASTVATTLLDAHGSLVFQVEVLPHHHALVITDVLGGYIGRKLYMPEPWAAINYISRMFPASTRMALPTWSEVVTVYPQRFVECTKFDHEFLPTDGYIMITNNRICKFKVPTLDVRILGGHLYLDHLQDPLTETPVQHPDGVYEVHSSSNMLRVLRRRWDRQVTSSATEYETFRREVTYFGRLQEQ